VMVIWRLVELGPGGGSADKNMHDTWSQLCKRGQLKLDEISPRQVKSGYPAT